MNSVSHVFIVNGRLAPEKMERIKVAVQSCFASDQYRLEATEYGGHARVLAKQAVMEGVPTIVAAGGDGTVHEVMQELAGTSCRLGIIPTGSGNGLARHCGIPLAVPEAVKLIETATPVPIDLGRINDIYFISNAGVGFDAVVCQAIRQTRLRGLPMYVRVVLQHFFSYKRSTYFLQQHDTIQEEKAFMITIANGREFGYGFQVAPEASLQDGQLDLIGIRAMNLWYGLQVAWRAWRKKSLQNKNVFYFRTRELSIRSEALTCFQADGDAHACEGVCRVRVIPAALHLLLPSNQNV